MWMWMGRHSVASRLVSRQKGARTAFASSSMTSLPTWCLPSESKRACLTTIVRRVISWFCYLHISADGSCCLHSSGTKNNANKLASMANTPHHHASKLASATTTSSTIATTIACPPNNNNTNDNIVHAKTDKSNVSNQEYYHWESSCTRMSMVNKLWTFLTYIIHLNQLSANKCRNGILFIHTPI